MGGAYLRPVLAASANYFIGKEHSVLLLRRLEELAKKKNHPGAKEMIEGYFFGGKKKKTYRDLGEWLEKNRLYYSIPHIKLVCRMALKIEKNRERNPRNMIPWAEKACQLGFASWQELLGSWDKTDSELAKTLKVPRSAIGNQRLKWGILNPYFSRRGRPPKRPKGRKNDRS